MAQCPVTIDGDDFVMTNVAVDGNDLAFYYEVNPEKYDFSDNAPVYRDLLYDGLKEELSARFQRHPAQTDEKPRFRC